MANQELVKGALARLGLVPSRADQTGTRSETISFVSWHSPNRGKRTGRVVMSDGEEWVLVISEQTSTLTWVRGNLLHA